MLLLIENQARDYLIVTTLLDNFGKPLTTLGWKHTNSPFFFRQVTKSRGN